MKLTTVLGLGALGFLYIHNRRGGEWTFESFGQTARDLIGQAKGSAREFQERAGQVVHDVAEKAQQMGEKSQSSSMSMGDLGSSKPIGQP